MPTKAALWPAFPANDAHRHRPPRLDGDAPENEIADALDRAAHVVGFAGGDAARGEHQVVIGRGVAKRARKLLGFVGENAEIGHQRAQPLQQLDQQKAVGVVDGGGAAHAAGLDHLVAGGEDRDLQPPAHLELGQAERGGERDVLRLQHGTGRHHHAAGRHVLAGEPPVGAELQPARHGDVIAFDRDVFLHEDRVGALGHRRAGEDSDGLPGT